MKNRNKLRLENGRRICKCEKMLDANQINNESAIIKYQVCDCVSGAQNSGETFQNDA